MAMPRVVHVTSVHQPFDVRIYYKECLSLARAGYDVTLIAPHVREEIRDGVRIQPIHRRASRWQRLTRTALEVFRKVVRTPAEVYHLHDPELLPVGLYLAWRGRQVIYDAHEKIEADILDKDYIPSPLRPILACVLRFLLRLVRARFAAVVCATPSIAEAFSPRAVVVRNLPFSDAAATPPADYAARAAAVTYVGVISAPRGIFEMLAAVEELNRTIPVTFLLAGAFSPESLQARVEKHPAFRYVTYFGQLHAPEVRRVLDQARCGLVLLHPLRNYMDGYPTKFFDYMAAGLPAVVSDLPAWRDLMEPVGCALFVDPSSVGQITEAVRWILLHPSEAEKMGSRGLTTVRDGCNWNTESETLISLYDRLCGIQTGTSKGAHAQCEV